MVNLCSSLAIITSSLFIIASASSTNQHNTVHNTDNRNNSTSKQQPATKKQRLKLIGYASDTIPAHHLISFSDRYDLDLQLIGTGKPWKGFNDKISGFYKYIESMDNIHNDNIILILDSYDTVPICTANGLLNKFNAFNADIVMATGKDCWPDPNVDSFLHERLTQIEKEKHIFFPWFLCPNSGAIMGRHDAMLSMFRRVQNLVSIGNGSCNDFEGNEFSRNTQSDQRCYTTYFVELTKYHEYEQQKYNITVTEGSEGSDVYFSKSKDGTISKHYFARHDAELQEFYKNITMKLDYTNDLFVSMGGMMFMDFDINADTESVSIKSKITNGSACILHGNGPGVVLWRSLIKQLRHKGNLYIDDYVLRVGFDLFVYAVWWLVMPAERFIHWLSVTYGVDFGIKIHSTTFSEQFIWKFHIWTIVFIVFMCAVPLLYWYKYVFLKRKNIKIKIDDEQIEHTSGEQKNKSFSFDIHENILNNNHVITRKLVEALDNFDITVVHHNGSVKLKTHKKY